MWGRCSRDEGFHGWFLDFGEPIINGWAGWPAYEPGEGSESGAVGVRESFGLFGGEGFLEGERALLRWVIEKEWMERRCGGDGSQGGKPCLPFAKPWLWKCHRYAKQNGFLHFSAGLKSINIFVIIINRIAFNTFSFPFWMDLGINKIYDY